MAKLSSYEIDKSFIQFLEKEELSKEQQKIDSALENYRNKPGSLIPVLQYVQQLVRYLPLEAQDYIAAKLNIPSSIVYGVVSFYSFFTMKPRGDHIIRICLGTACYVKGGDKIVNNIEKTLKIKDGETTEDHKFTLQVVRCLGACGIAPLMVIDEKVHGRLNEKEAEKIVQNIVNEGSNTNG